MLPEQAVGVFVGAALPRAVRIGEVDLQAGIDAELSVLDLGDATLLPGLIDSHVHLAFDPDNKSKQAIADEEAHTTLARMPVHAGQQLRAGVTTVRDLGDRDHLAVSLRDHYTAGTEAGPEILAAGPPITRRRGHCCPWAAKPTASRPCRPQSRTALHTAPT
ncbi:amidohydrolase family protein [Streptomyces sp. NPDC048483]|uniref:amidohydrolase family protein n=1 Tax=Streptomyces sp. NPDC048483 TaxID=3154927 RepID=UPI00343B64FA